MFGNASPLASLMARIHGDRSRLEHFHPRLTVFGVGGAGGNALNNMIRSGLRGVGFVAVNTDAQALGQSLARNRVQLGRNLTHGLGAGSRPEIGRAAVKESLGEVLTCLEGTHMVFITGGMGGGTGTGAAPAIARAAREQGILSVAVVTKPFTFEGPHRMRTARAGIRELQQFVDTMIVIPNQTLFRIADDETTVLDAFRLADDILLKGVGGLVNLMVRPGLVNLDFADIRTAMRLPGNATMGMGEAEGPDRANKAAKEAIANPLLSEVSLQGARGVIVNVTGGRDMTLADIDDAVGQVREKIDRKANLIFGSACEPSLTGRLQVTIFATGIDADSFGPRTATRSGTDPHIGTKVRNAGVEPAPLPAARGRRAEIRNRSGRAAA